MAWLHVLRSDSEESSSRKPGRQEGARFALLVLTAINLLNYIDRYVPSAVKEPIKEELGLTDAQTAWPLTGMILVYMVTSPIFGWIADKQIMNRRVMMFFAIVFWSVATALAALAWDLASLIAFRSLVGVGEACYVVVSTPLISDLYPSQERNVALGFFYLAIPVGGALGYAVGGVVGQALGWREAFLACGIPGIVVAFLVLFINEPPRGINDDPVDPAQEEENQSLTHYEAYRLILSNHYFLATLGGMTANNFSIGGFADWMTTFLHRYQGMRLEGAGLVTGASAVVGGIGGLTLGASTAEYFKRKGIKHAYLKVSAAYTIPATVLAFLAINAKSAGAASATFLLAQIFVWTFTSPIGTIAIECLEPHLRARSMAALVFIQHMLGDVISPPIVGAISDRTGSLRLACQILPPFLLLSGLFYMWPVLTLPELPSQGNHRAEGRMSFWKVLVLPPEEASEPVRGDEEGDQVNRASSLVPDWMGPKAR